MATTNMGLTLPVVSSTLGPQWATLVNAAFEDIDSHDHTAGNGKKVPVNGLNINSDLPLGGYSLTSAKSIDFSSLASAGATTSSLSVVNGNLYFRDSSSNLIQITVGGAVNAGGSGNITGLASPGQALFIPGANEFTWYANSSTLQLAVMNVGTVALYPSSYIAANRVYLSASPSLSTIYTMRSPTAAPAASSVMMVRNAGAAIGQQEYAVLDGSTLEENPTGTIKVKTITDANISNLSIAPTKINKSSYSSGSTVSQTYTPNGTEQVYHSFTFTPSYAGLHRVLSSYQTSSPPSSVAGYRCWMVNTGVSGDVFGSAYIKLTSATMGTIYVAVTAKTEANSWSQVPPIDGLVTLYNEPTTMSFCVFSGYANAQFQIQYITMYAYNI